MKRLALLGALVLLLLTVAVPVAAKKADAPGQNKTYVCHHTGSDSNPIVIVEVANGWDKGHGNKKSSKHQMDDEELSGYNGKSGPAKNRGVDAGDCGTTTEPPTTTTTTEAQT